MVFSTEAEAPTEATTAASPESDTQQQQQPVASSVSGEAASENEASPPPAAAEATAEAKWPGLPRDNVFRLIVPVLEVGRITGCKGEIVKKMCEDTGARISILRGSIRTTDRIVLISGKEDPDAQLSPAMDAVLRVIKCVAGLSPSEGDSKGFAAAVTAFCHVRLLVASSEAIHLLGKRGSIIKSMQDRSGALIRVLSKKVPSYATSDERIVEIQGGDSLSALKALEAVLGILRKFLVDHSAVHQFEKMYNATISQDPAAPKETQITCTMQVPLKHAEHIVGVAGANVVRIHRTSGAHLTVSETVGSLDKATVEIRGTSSQVQEAQQLILKSVRLEPAPGSSCYSTLAGTYVSSSFASERFGNIMTDSRVLAHPLGASFNRSVGAPMQQSLSHEPHYSRHMQSMVHDSHYPPSMPFLPTSHVGLGHGYQGTRPSSGVPGGLLALQFGTLKPFRD